MTSIPMLATCGLLYALAATTPEIDAAKRVMANDAVDRIANLASREGQIEAVSAAMWQLVARLKEHPEEIEQLSLIAGPACREMAGL